MDAGKNEHASRFKTCVAALRAKACDRVDPTTGEVLIAKQEWANYKVHVVSMNTFPTAAGLASSAAGYACLVYALSKLFCCTESPNDLSVVARQVGGDVVVRVCMCACVRACVRHVRTNHTPRLNAYPIWLPAGLGFGVPLTLRRIRTVEQGQRRGGVGGLAGGAGSDQRGLARSGHADHGSERRQKGHQLYLGHGNLRAGVCYPPVQGQVCHYAMETPASYSFTYPP